MNRGAWQAMGQATVGHREGDGTPLQYSYLENPMDGGIFTTRAAWEAQELCLALDIKGSEHLLIRFSESFLFYLSR